MSDEKTRRALSKAFHLLPPESTAKEESTIQGMRPSFAGPMQEPACAHPGKTKRKPRQSLIIPRGQAMESCVTSSRILLSAVLTPSLAWTESSSPKPKSSAGMVNHQASGAWPKTSRANASRVRGSAACAMTWDELAGDSLRKRTSRGESTEASTNTTHPARATGSASSGVSCGETSVLTPGKFKPATASATIGPTPSSRRKVFP